MTLNWGAGVTTPQTCSIPILNDAVVEGPKNVVLRLVNPPGNAGVLTFTPFAGGAQPVSAQLIIMRIK